jgi:hypothetical protein
MTTRGYSLGADWSRSGDYSGALEDVPGTMVDGTEDIAASWGRADARTTSDATAGRLTFRLLNQDRNFSPDNPDSPLYKQGITGTPARLTMRAPADTGAQRTLFEGVIDAYQVDPTRGRQATFSGGAGDGWGIPGDTVLSTEVYEGKRTGELIDIVLDEISWPADKRDIDPGATFVPYWWAEGTDARTAVNDLVHSEGLPAIAYVKGGVFIFRDRHHRVTHAASLSSQGTYTHLSPAGSTVTYVSDTFTRSLSGGWGSTDTGRAWTVGSGSTADFSVSTGAGRISLGTVNAERVISLPVSPDDVDVAATFTTSAAASGASVNGYLIARHSASYRYLARLAFQVGGALGVGIERTTSTGFASTGVQATGVTYSANTGYRMRMEVAGTTIRARAWLASGAEPSTWHATMTDDSLAGAGNVGVRAILTSGNTNTLPVTLSVDDLVVTSPGSDHKILKGSFVYDDGHEHVVNTATLEVSPWLPQETQIVWSAEGPITLNANEVATLIMRTDDPFIDLILPSAAVKYLDDGGVLTSDYTLAFGSVSFALSRTSGQSAFLTITAGVGGALLNTGVRVRGAPLRRGPARKFSAEDPASRAVHGDHDWDGAAPWAYFYDAQAIVDRVVAIHARPQPSVVFEVDGVTGAHTLARIADTAIGDRITVRNDEVGIDTDFYVEQLTHVIVKLGIRHRLTIGAQVAEPTQAVNPFTFDAAGAGFDQGQFGMDAVNNPTTMFRFDVTGQGFNQGVFAT